MGEISFSSFILMRLQCFCAFNFLFFRPELFRLDKCALTTFGKSGQTTRAPGICKIKPSFAVLSGNSHQVSTFPVTCVFRF